MSLVQLFWTLMVAVPTNNYVGYDHTGTNWTRIVSSAICQTMRFESRIQAPGVYRLQIAYSTNGGWEEFGTPITAPTTNIQIVPVPKGEQYFRLTKK